MFARSTFRAIYAGVLAVFALATCAVGLSIWRDRTEAIASGVRNTRNIATLLGGQIERSIQSIDIILLNLRHSIEEPKIASMSDPLRILDPGNLRDLMLQRLATLPQAFQIAVTDSRGQIVLSTASWPTPIINVADREYYKELAANDDDRLSISLPFENRGTGEPTLALARRISGPDRAFLGTVFVSVKRSYFESVYRAVDSLPDQTFLLLRRDGTVLILYPHGQASSGQKIAVTQPFFAAVVNGGGSYRAISAFDQKVRWAAVNPLKDYPLVVNSGIPEQVLLRDWQKRTALTIVATLVILASALLLLSIMARQYRKLSDSEKSLADKSQALDREHQTLEQEHLQLLENEVKLRKNEATLRNTESELRSQNQRFDAALNNMGQGLVMYDAEARLVVCNDRYIEMYKLSREDMQPGRTLREVLRARQKLTGFPADLDSYMTEFMASVSRDESTTREIRCNDGCIVQITRHPMDNGGWVATHEDITDRRASEEKLRTQNQRFDVALNNMSQGLAIFDRDGRLVLCNEGYRSSHRLSVEQAQPGLPLREIVAHCHEHCGFSADVDDYIANIHDMVSNRMPREHEIKDGDGRVFAVKNEPMPDGGWVVTFNDITDRRRADARIERLAHNDLLTGIANRPSFLDRIELARDHLRASGQPFTVLMLDLDHFKHVNDSLGHAAGDALLKETARRLEASLRSADVLARLGGDEFAIIQVPPRDFKSQDEALPVMRESAIALANRIIELISQPFDIEGHKTVIGTSIGIAMAPFDGADPDELMKKADLALYKAKSEGRNGYTFFDLQLAVFAAERNRLEEDLRRALERNELELYYQPQVDVATGRQCGMEALVRWHHPERGFVTPGKFIPLAEDTGLITSLGEWILQSACAEAAKWPANVKVAINISPVQFRKTNLFDVIMCALIDSGLPPERLEIEITERVLLEHDADYLSTLHQLKNLGISIALDDFGTGHSSIAYLKMFSFDKIKIDHSFISDVQHADSAAIACAIINLGRSLDIVTVAEGVETQAQFQMLRAAGVSQVQGHLFGHPMPASQLEFDVTDAASADVRRQARA